MSSQVTFYNASHLPCHYELSEAIPNDISGSARKEIHAAALLAT